MDYFKSCVILDLKSGTYFSAIDAVIINLNNLTENELVNFQQGSDSDRKIIGQKHGTDIEVLEYAHLMSDYSLDF